jgi:hypothetical protein
MRRFFERIGTLFTVALLVLDLVSKEESGEFVSFDFGDEI